MILQQLDILIPKRPFIGVDKVLQQKRRQYKRSLVRTRRAIRAYVRTQYYLTDAVADSRRAFSRNEDIALACLFIIAVASFSTISILANLIYTFVLAASILSTLSGTNLALLIFAAFGVLSVLAAWAAAWFQNTLSIALLEGATGKRNRSLRLTLRSGLRYASRTASGWTILAVAAFVPAGAVALIGMAIPYLLHSNLVTNPAYLVGLGSISATWVVWVLANFTLLPYVLLFEQFTTWKNAVVRSRQLVRTRGKLFTLGGHATFAVGLAGLYAVALALQQLSHINPTITFMLLSTVAVTCGNAILTLFYRKRKLARK